MTEKTIRIATRASALALWQAEHVRSALLHARPQLAVELVPMATTGDQRLNTPLYKIGGKGLFVKTLEQALLDGHADVAVHSMKDVPIQLADDFCLAAIMRREAPYDALVSTHYHSVDALPFGAVVGTTSLRRRCQLLSRRRDLQCRNLRGNLSTRLNRLGQGQFDAVVLAYAGLKRLGYTRRIKQRLPLSLSLPAAGQGAIGIECLAAAHDAHALLKPLNDAPSAQCVAAERALCRHLNADCHSPIAAYAENQTAQIKLRAVVGTPDGQRLLRGEACGVDASAVADSVAHTLYKQGAEQVLAISRRWCHAQ